VPRSPSTPEGDQEIEEQDVEDPGRDVGLARKLTPRPDIEHVADRFEKTGRLVCLSDRGDRRAI
jgi:hypothetical protein